MTVNEMEYPVSVRWRGGRLAHADARGKESLELATPPEFRGGLTGYWSPEEMLVAATASCFALTLAAVADRSDAPLLDATVGATGHVRRSDDGRLGFTLIEIDAVLETVPGGEDAVAAAATSAEDRCLVSQTLDVPVQVTVQVKTVVPHGRRRGAQPPPLRGVVEEAGGATGLEARPAGESESTTIRPALGEKSRI